MQVDFPAPFGPDHGGDPGRREVEVDAVDGGEGAEALRQPPDFDDRLLRVRRGESTAWAALSLMPSLLIAPGTSVPMRSPAARWAAAPHRAGGGTTRRSG